MSRLLLLLLLLSASLPSQAGDSDCRLALQETVLLFEDPGGALTVDVVSRLPAERFQALHRGAFPYSFSYSAFWLRLQVRNPGTEFCHAWLQVGEPRLEQVQVFQHQDGQWHECVPAVFTRCRNGACSSANRCSRYWSWPGKSAR